MRVGIVPAAVLLGSCASAAAAPAAPPQRVERHLSAMGTELTLVVEAAERAAALAASERAVRAIEVVEARLSTWRDDSELARLNRAPVGEPVPLSAELAAELSAAADCRRRTGGAFDPGVGALVDAWGLRTGGREPGDEELESALAASGLRHLDLLPPSDGAGTATAVRRHPGLRIEEGGFGKGAGLAAAAAALAPLLAGDSAAIRAASIDLGGQLVFLGTPAAAVPPLEALVAAGHDVRLVVSQADKKRGRGGALVPSPVKAAA
ncbi:MAG TPA: FAD:protein FMN transferase, partial [Thermoanaerobaculia bacterium]